MNIPELTRSLGGDFEETIGPVEMEAMPFTQLPATRKRKRALASDKACQLCLLPAKGYPGNPLVISQFYEHEEFQMKSCDESNFYRSMAIFYNTFCVGADKEHPQPRDVPVKQQIDKPQAGKLNLKEVTLEEVRDHYHHTEHTITKAVFAFTKRLSRISEIVEHFEDQILWRESPQGGPIPDAANMKMYLESLKRWSELWSAREKLVNPSQINKPKPG